MSLALLGDALLYAVLPAYASEFGLTLPWVGVMPSANRFVRVFAYGVIARLATGLGLRKMCLWAAVTATLSKAAYSVVEGPALMPGTGQIRRLTFQNVSFLHLLVIGESPLRAQSLFWVGVCRA